MCGNSTITDEALSFFLFYSTVQYVLYSYNHHAPSKIDGLDFQIQWEADLLENLTVMDKEKEQ